MISQHQEEEAVVMQEGMKQITNIKVFRKSAIRDPYLIIKLRILIVRKVRYQIPIPNQYWALCTRVINNNIVIKYRKQ